MEMLITTVIFIYLERKVHVNQCGAVVVPEGHAGLSVGERGCLRWG